MILRLASDLDPYPKVKRKGIPRRGLRYRLTIAVLFVVMVGCSLPFLGVGYAALWERFPIIHPYEPLANIVFVILWLITASVLTSGVMTIVRWLNTDNPRKKKQPTL